MKKILVPVEIPDLISLQEALNWVGFHVLPIYDAEVGDVFLHHRSFFPKDAYDFADRGGTVFDTLPNFPAPDDPQYDVKTKRYFDEFEAALEPAKAKLLQELRGGTINCYGTLIRKLKSDSAPDAWRNSDSALWENVPPSDTQPDAEYLHITSGSIFLGARGEVRTEEIPASFWRMEGIEWSMSSARAAIGWYEKIWLYTDGLFARFPPVPTGEITLPVIHGAIVVDATENKKGRTSDARKGRPPMDWDSFHLEMTARLQKGDIPNKQESFVQDMQTWCLKTWGKEPGRSTVLQKVSPFYDRFVRKKSGNADA